MPIMLDKRKNHLLSAIVEHYTKTAEPVGSKFIVEKRKLHLSPATIRNEMSILEDGGYIYQPHTSAGRIPTDKGYQYYVDHFLVYQEVKKPEKDFLLKIMNAKHERFVKEFAKGLSELTEQTVLIGFSPNDTYYTGISHLFAKPEFTQQQFVYYMSEIIDRLDEVMNKIFEDIGDDIVIYIGRHNPFGPKCSTLVGRYKTKKYGRGIMGFLGPMRMDYNRNYSLLKYVQKFIEKNK